MEANLELGLDVNVLESSLFEGSQLPAALVLDVLVLVLVEFLLGLLVVAVDVSDDNEV